jgi:hypothetical protein
VEDFLDHDDDEDCDDDDGHDGFGGLHTETGWSVKFTFKASVTFPRAWCVANSVLSKLNEEHSNAEGVDVSVLRQSVFGVLLRAQPSSMHHANAVTQITHWVAKAVLLCSLPPTTNRLSSLAQVTSKQCNQVTSKQCDNHNKRICCMLTLHGSDSI